VAPAERESTTIRLFIAVDVPQDVCTALADIARRLNAHWPAGAVRWTPAGKQHLTLRFLGATAPTRVPTVTAALDELVAAESPFVLRLEGTGTFPQTGSARVLWVGLCDDDGCRRLLALQRRLEERVQKLGWQAESRSYHPHLTLGRLRRQTPAPVGDWKQHMPEPTVVPVDELVLMRSDLQDSGPQYTNLHTARLG
jgi:2'-5' RNA ligase